MTGASNSSVQRYRELARNSTKSGVERQILLEGLHVLFEAQASRISIESAAFESSALSDPPVRRLAEQLAAEGAEVLVVSRDVLEAMSPVKTPSGAVGIGNRSFSSLTAALKGRSLLAIVASEIQDPGNVGGIMRTAEAAGATAFIASPGTADPLGWKAVRGSMGSALRLPIARASVDECLRECRKAGIITTALVPRGGRPFFGVDFRGPTALVLGGEGLGLDGDIARQTDQQVSIPMQTPVESLNVGVAAALVLYEAFRQRRDDRLDRTK